jgi:hypothetical protein
MVTRTRFALATVLALFSGVVVYGQVDRANLNGTVTDSSRAVVAAARVELVSRETGLKRVVETGPTGIYDIAGLPIGTYHLTISRAGFRTFEVNGIQLFVGQTRTVDAELQVGTVSEDVQVQATVAPLETNNARVGAVLEHQQLGDIPINGRSWATLEILAPGAINAGGGGQRDIRFVGRGRDDNNYTFDGIDATGVQEQSQKADARLNISLESIAEFRVESAVYTAESGSSGGAQVNAVSKTGTNTFHGALFEFLRDSVFDARSPFDPSEIPPFRMNQFGANVGGPIAHNRTFFFANYEAIRQSLTQTVVGFVPNASFRARVLATSPALKPILDGWPVGQTPIDSITDLYKAPGVNSVREDSVTGRVDHSLTDHTSMFVRYNIDDAFIDRPFDQVGSRDTESIRPSNLVVQVMHVVACDCRRLGRNGRNRAGPKCVVPCLRPERRNLRRSTEFHDQFGVPASDWTRPESLERQRRCGEPDRRMAAEWNSDGEDRSSSEYHGDPESIGHAGWQQQELAAGLGSRRADLSDGSDHQQLVQSRGLRRTGERNVGQFRTQCCSRPRVLGNRHCARENHLHWGKGECEVPSGGV